MEKGVRHGQLVDGTRLPTVRGLAAELGVSAGTVAAAYRALRDRGVVVTDGRRGTRVGRRPPLAPVGRPPSRPVLTGTRDLATGNPDPELLFDLGPPLSRAAGHARLYGGSAVLPALADLGRAGFAADGVDARSFTVVAGALDGVERVLGAHLRPGDRVAVEDPGYPPVLDLGAALGLTVVPVAVDDDGPLPSALRAALSAGAKALIVTVRAQNPTGGALSPPRARVLRRLLEQHTEVLVVEDDHAGPVAGVDAVSLVGHGRRPRWAVVRSVAKALGPDLRLALLAGDATTVSRVEGRLALGPGWVSGLLQGAVADLLGNPATARRLDHAAGVYAGRRSALVAALGERGVASTGRSGMNVWVPVVDEASVVAGLLSEGIAVSAGSRFRTSSGAGVRVTVSTLMPSEAPAVADALARAVAIAAAPVRTG